MNKNHAEPKKDEAEPLADLGDQQCGAKIVEHLDVL